MIIENDMRHIVGMLWLRVMALEFVAKHGLTLFAANQTGAQQIDNYLLAIALLHHRHVQIECRRRRLETARHLHFVRTDLNAGLFPEQRHRTARLHVRWTFAIEVNHLFGLDEIGHMTFVIGAPHVETCAGAFATQTWYDSGACLSAASIHCANLHRATHHFQKPKWAVYVKAHELYVKHAVPEEAPIGFASSAASLGAQRQIKCIGWGIWADNAAPRKVKRTRIEHFANLQRSGIFGQYTVIWGEINSIQIIQMRCACVLIDWCNRWMYNWGVRVSVWDVCG